MEGYLKAKESLNTVDEIEEVVTKLLEDNADDLLKELADAIDLETFFKDNWPKFKNKSKLSQDLFDVFHTQFSTIMPTYVEAYVQKTDAELTVTKLTKRTTDWISSWSSDLADIMKLDTETEIEAVLKKGLNDGKGIKYIEKNGTTTAEVQMAAEALIAAGVKAVFTPTDNTVMTAELSIYETFIEAGVQHYTGADSFALNGAFVGYGVDYVQRGEATADMVVELLCDGKTPADLPFQTFDNGIATINTETCETLGLDLDTVKKAFAPYCTEVVEVTTAENFGWCIECLIIRIHNNTGKNGTDCAENPAV